MTVWQFEPRDPLVVRDGRPNQARNESSTLPFPFPGTVAGLVRTRLGTDEHGTFVFHDRLGDLLKVSVRGPLLGPAEASHDIFYVPAPKDALIVQDPASNKEKLHRLHPIDQPPSTMRDGDVDEKQRLVGQDADEKAVGKPSRKAPSWWSWANMLTWLVEPQTLTAEQVTHDGLGPLPVESRVHVKLGISGTAEEGMLFATDGLRFLKQNEKWSSRKSLDVLSLAALVDISGQSDNMTMRPGVAPAAGERRLVVWSERGSSLPELPKQVVDHVRSGDKAVVRVVLLTPGAFAEGWRPTWLLEDTDQVSIELQASSVGRPQTVSGWDFKARAPKPTRRLAPAGSVYWVELSGPADAREAWVREHWMQNASDKEQDRRDGYGLAVIGVAS